MILALALPLAAAGPLDLDASVHTLDDGLTVLLHEDHRTDEVVLFLRYGVGAKDELPGEYGCAHLFEHLMFEGSANVPGNSFDAWLTAGGGDNNAWTSEDETVYHQVFPSGALDLALFLESDRMGFLRDGLTQENLENQQSVVLQERYRNYDAPNGRDYDAVGMLLYPPDHPYGHTVLGTVADVEGFTIDGVVSFWERNYRPRNAVLAVVGNIDEAEALAAVEHWFSDVPDRGPANVLTEYPLPEPVSADGLLEDEVEQTTLYLAWPTVPHLDPDEPALELLAEVLSDGRGTRLDDALYFGKKHITNSNTWTSNGTLHGWFLLEVSSDRYDAPKLDHLVGKVFRDLERRPITAAELDRARRTLRANLLDNTERPIDQAQLLVDCYVDTGAPACLSDQWAAYEAVTTDDLMRVARAWLAPERRVTLSVVPNGSADLALPGATPVELP